MPEIESFGEREAAVIELHLSRGADPIAGCLWLLSGEAGERPCWEFVGWLAFARALECGLEADSRAWQARNRASDL